MATASRRSPRQADFLLIVAAAGYGKTIALEAACAKRPSVYRLAAELVDGEPVDLPSGPTGQLAVDDVGVLTEPDQLRLGRVLATLPDRTRVALATRTPLPGPVLAVLPGPVAERGPADLALGPEATCRVLREEHGVGDPDLGYLVHGLTAGWPALVQLAGEALGRQGAGRRDLLDALSEPGTAGATWVRDQVLPGLPPDAELLLRVAVEFDPVSASLAAAVAGAAPEAAGRGTVGDGSSPERADRMAAALRWLVRIGLLVSSPDRTGAERTVRLVPVLRAALHHERDGRRNLREARRVAAGWYRANGHPLSAAQVLAAVGDAHGCAAVIETDGDRMLASGGATAVARLVDGLPESTRTPAVRLVLADARRMAGDVAGSGETFAPLFAEAERTGRWQPGLAWRHAMLSYMRGDYRGALDLLDRAAPSAGEGGPTADDVLVQAGRATVLVVLGETGAAQEAAARALSAAAEAGDDRAWATAHLAAAHTAIGVRRDEHLAKALAAAERGGDVVQQARILANQADCLLREARYPQALEVATRAVRAAELGAPPGVLVTALHNAGEALTRLGRYDEAVLHFERSIQVSHRAQLSRTAPGLYGLGEVRRQLGRREQSRVAFEEAAELARSHAELQILVPALVGLARLLAEAGELPPARAASDEALAVAPPTLAARARAAAGWVDLAEGDADGARRHAADAVRAARACRQADDMAESLELAAVAGANIEETRAALREAVSIWERAGARPAADRMLLMLGQLPGADGAARWAARCAAKRLVAIGVPVADAEQLLPAEAATPVRVHVLGRFEVLVGGRPVPLTAWRSRQARTLLKILVARRGRPVPRAELCEMLWPDDEPRRTAHRLSVLLSVVRTVLDPARLRPADHYLQADLAGVSFDITRVDVDVEGLLRDAAHGLQLIRDGQHDRAREILGEVDAAYRGDAFDDEPYEDWADGLREQARAVWLRALRELAQLCRQANDLDQAATALVRLLAADPFDESAHRMLVEVLRRAGRHGEAQRAFHRWAEAMRSVDAPAPDPAVLRTSSGLNRGRSPHR